MRLFRRQRCVDERRIIANCSYITADWQRTTTIMFVDGQHALIGQSIDLIKVNWAQQTVVFLIKFFWINTQANFDSLWIFIDWDALSLLLLLLFNIEKIWLTSMTFRHVQTFLSWIRIPTTNRCRCRHIRTEIEYERTVLYYICRINLKKTVRDKSLDVCPLLWSSKSCRITRIDSCSCIVYHLFAQIH